MLWDKLQRPQVPLNVAKASLELCLGPIPGWVGWGGVGPIVIIRLSQFNCNCNCILKLSLAIFKDIIRDTCFISKPGV